MLDEIGEEFSIYNGAQVSSTCLNEDLIHLTAMKNIEYRMQDKIGVNIYYKKLV